MLRLGTELLIRRKVQIPLPIYDLPVCIVRLLCAERRPADQTLEHDRAYTPPIAPEIVTLSTKNLRRDVVGRAHCRVGELTPRLAPSVDLVAIGDGELDLVDRDGIAVLADGFRSCCRHELLVVGSRVLFGETGGKTEVRELDVSTAVQKYIVRFDVPGCSISDVQTPEGQDSTYRCMKPSLCTASMASVISAM